MRLIIAVSFAVSVIQITPRILAVKKGYGLDGIFLSAAAIPEFDFLPGFVPIAALLGIMILSRFYVTYTLAKTVAFVSLKSEGYFSAVVSALSVTALPPLLQSLGIKGVSYLTLYPVFNLIYSVYSGGFSLFVCLAIFAFSLILNKELSDRMKFRAIGFEE